MEFLGMTAVLSSASMRRLITTAERVAKTDSPVLITGESGSGKELIARAIHRFSPRSAKPFIDVNCAALPEHLVESELFGYEKGAFSGADTQKPGLLEAAQGGSVFLDEIGELESRIQAKLLRVLDGHPWFRLGGTKKVQCDARIIAATNLDVEDAVRHGRFRRDLFHRLDVFRLHVPALRERMEDVAPLASYFLQGSAFTLSGEALAQLEEYAWPGNVRELKNVLAKAMLFASGNEVGAHDLPMELFAPHESAAEETSLGGLEQQAIFRALGQTNGHQQKAADLLGISRRTLIRKLKQYRGSGRSGQDD